MPLETCWVSSPLRAHGNTKFRQVRPFYSERADSLILVMFIRGANKSDVSAGTRIMSWEFYNMHLFAEIIELFSRRTMQVAVNNNGAGNFVFIKIICKAPRWRLLIFGFVRIFGSGWLSNGVDANGVIFFANRLSWAHFCWFGLFFATNKLSGVNLANKGCLSVPLEINMTCILKSSGLEWHVDVN